MLRNYLDLPRGVYILCAGSFINRAGSFLVTFLTIYLVRRLGFSEVAATTAMGVFGLGSMCAALIGGHLADHIGRKTVMLIGLAGSATLMVAFSFVSSYPLILAAIFCLALLADMYRPAASAMIADLVEPSRRPHAYGLMYVSINLGFAVAPVAGGMLAKYSFRLLFWLDALTSLAYAGIILFRIRETLPGRPPSGAPPSESVGAAEAARIIARDRVFILFCAATLMIAMVYQQAVSTLPLYLQHLGIGPEKYGRIIALNGLLIVCMQIPITSAIQRFDRFRVLVVSASITGIGFGLFGLAGTATHFAIGVVIWTIGEMLQSPILPSVVTELAPLRLRARYFGLMNMCFSGGNMIAAPIGGLVLSRFGPTALWMVCLGLPLLSAVVYGSLRRAAAARILPEQRP